MMLKTNTGEWIRAADPTNAYPDAGTSNALWFADRMASHFPDRIIGIVNAAKGGTYLATGEPNMNWLPAYSSGTLFGNMAKFARQAVQLSSGTLKAFIWYQGEAETALRDDIIKYDSRMYNLFGAVRREFGADFPIVFVKLGPKPNNPSRPYWDDLKAWQQAIADTAAAAHNFKLVDASPLAIMDSSGHLDQPSQIQLGQWLADAALPMIS